MRVIELSDHPGDLLRKLGRARAGQRWRAWLRAVLAMARGRRPQPAGPRTGGPVRDQAAILTAGVRGEQLAAARLGRALGDEWVLLRGYRNRRGEIDHLLLGPRGLFAIESKHRNATVSCAGDRWWFEKYDRYGNRVDHGPMTDRRGRSPSVQLNEPASQLGAFLRSRGHPVPVQRVVLLTHPRSRLGKCSSPTVYIATSADQVIGLLTGHPADIAGSELAKLEQLIVHDHQYHDKQRPR